MLRVLTLATLFPDATRPQFGPFVERQTMELAALPDVEVRVIAPIGIPPLGRLFSRYRKLAALSAQEVWKGLTVYRPRFAHLPGVSGRLDAALLARDLVPLLREIRAEFAFDVIDAEFFFPDGPAAVALGKAFGVPVSIKARGADIHAWGSAGPTRRQIVDAGRAADGMLCVSAAIRADMVALGIPGDRIAVHYTGLDHARFYVRDRVAAKASLGIFGPVLVSVGALIERKGHGLAVAALADVPGATLVLIGAGAERAALEALAVRVGVADRVRFLGSVDQDVIADWLAAADVMVLISASEGLANAWVEALASGTPVVIADVGGAREVVDRAGAGRLVTREPGAIAGAVRELLSEPPDREVVAGAAARFSWEANAVQLRAHLKGLL
ncbi:glycosyltransferase family 4 protein [Sphingomonas paeninsulae]|jgi:teichuronic acid biosynthesis glycosyltransferase TuaC|uniref:Glycosyltransferase family 4 protein n=1 Tax=Sphingomonas paeninsulae TaxID=2319844 RepID=A0A494TCJ5_SPHPE|nr:glycosyltransferase [Sphingomonas paeninsulae]AYJ87177.1 glycosyltransferase family 4 protein [Sphingomonas paeninsulae]